MFFEHFLKINIDCIRPYPALRQQTDEPCDIDGWYRGADKLLLWQRHYYFLAKPCSILRNKNIFFSSHPFPHNDNF